MKKFVKLILILVVMMLLGCGKVSEIVGEDLAQTLTENVLFSEQLTEINASNAEKRFLLNPKDYTELTSYVGTASACNEFAIIKTDDTETIIKKLNEYIDRTRQEYETYRPKQAKKLDLAIIAVYKDTVVMIITADTDGAKTANK